MITASTDTVHGNACCVQVTDCEGTPEVHFMADPHSGTERLWFCLTITGAEAPLRCRMVLDNPTGMLGISRDSAAQMRPVISCAGTDWERLPGGSTREHADGRVSFVWELDVPGPSATFAFCFPHGPKEIAELVAGSQNALISDVIGVSQKGRPLVRVANSYGDPDCPRPGVYCISHQHASEMSGAWVCHGFLQRMAELGKDAPIVWSVPITNIDGTLEGDYGKDPFPWDLNRAWGRVPMRHEVQETTRDMKLWKSRCTPALALDFHSPGGAEHSGVYTFLSTDSEWYRRQEPWADAIGEELGEFASPEFKRIPNYPGRFDDDRKFGIAFRQQFGVPSLTFETPYNCVEKRVLQIADFLDIGARIANGVMRRLSDR